MTDLRSDFGCGLLDTAAAAVSIEDVVGPNLRRIAASVFHARLFQPRPSDPNHPPVQGQLGMQEPIRMRPKSGGPLRRSSFRLRTKVAVALLLHGWRNLYPTLQTATAIPQPPPEMTMGVFPFGCNSMRHGVAHFCRRG